MPKFLYTTRDREGKVIHGTMDASGQDELISALQRRGLLVTAVVPEEKPGGIVPKARMRFHTRVKLDDLAMLARQLATLLGSGVTMLRAIETATRQIESKRLYLAMEDIRRNVEAGSSLWSALAKYPKIFSGYWVGLVETGESSGQLPTVLNELADYLETAGILQRKIVSALVYPAILICVVIGAISFFILRIIPTFAEIFGGFDVQIPALTRVLIDFSRAVRHNIFYIILFLFGLGFLTSRYIKTKSGRWRFDRLKLSLPIFGSLFHGVALARFSRGLATLIRSGVPILYSLEIITRAIGNKVVEKAIEEVKVGVRDGKTMAGPLAKNTIFPPMVIQMVSVGEETGKLGEMLSRIADHYEERVSTFIDRLTYIIEPVLIVFMGVVVGALVIAMYLPIFSIAKIGGG